MVPMHKQRNLFNSRRLMLLGLMALVLSTSLALTTGVASAKTASPTRAVTSSLASCFANGCDGANPISTGCYKDAQTEEFNVGAAPGVLGLTATIYLRYSSYCKTAWAKIVFSSALPSGYRGNAIITRNLDNRQYDCTTGYGVVLAGQTSCYSGMVYVAYTTAYAAGMFLSIGGNWLEFTRTTSK